MNGSLQGTYEERVEQVGEHWTFCMGRVDILVSVEIAEGDSYSEQSYYNAKYTAQACFKRLFGRYPERSDICSNPEEERRMATYPVFTKPRSAFVATDADKKEAFQ